MPGNRLPTILEDRTKETAREKVRVQVRSRKDKFHYYVRLNLELKNQDCKNQDREN